MTAALEVAVAEQAVEIAQMKLEMARSKLAAEPQRQVLHVRRREGSPTNARIREFFLEDVGTRFTTHVLLTALWIGYKAEEAIIKGTFSFKARKSFAVRIEQVAAYFADSGNGPTYQVYKSRLKRDPQRKRRDEHPNRQKLWWIVRDPEAKPEVKTGE